MLTLDSCATFHKGKGLPKSAISESGAEPCIHYGELFTRYGVAISETYNQTNEINNCIRSVSNDVLMPTSDVTPRGLAKASCVLIDGVILGGDILIIRPNSKRVFGTYLSCMIRYQERQVLQLVTGTTVYHLYGSEMRNFMVALPSYAEQVAIAEALCDVDDLITALDKTIAKKRDIKQAAMHQLLTGKIRLPGFNGEWVTKRLDEVAEIRSGGTPSTSEPSFWDGNISWCTPTDITALKGFKYLRETSRTITQAGLIESSAELIPAQSVLMTSRATIGECAINVIPMTTNQGFKNFVPFDTTDVHFLYYLLGMQKHGLITLCSGSTFLEIGKTQLAGYEVKLPSSKVEQTAIAVVLSEMDDELTLLEARLKKTHDLKQAMMQELLTGKTRLIDKERSNA